LTCGAASAAGFPALAPTGFAFAAAALGGAWCVALELAAAFVPAPPVLEATSVPAIAAMASTTTAETAATTLRRRSRSQLRHVRRASDGWRRGPGWLRSGTSS